MSLRHVCRVSHDDKVINFVTLSDLRGCNVKSWAKELKKLQKNPRLGSYFDVCLPFYFGDASPDLQPFRNLLAASYGSGCCMSALAQKKKHVGYQYTDLTYDAGTGGRIRSRRAEDGANF